MNWFKIFAIQFTFVCILFFGSDFVYTNYFRVANQETIYRIQHDIYHHSLLPSFDGIGKWGEISYRVCTDGNGFKSDCENIFTSQTSFDVAFIGDSFTEAIGMTYEDSFVGMFADTYPSINIANLGVLSYSPTIYRTKLQYLIEKGYRFNHVIVFIDISDINDESVYYRDSSGHILRHAIHLQSLNRIKFYIVSNFSLSTYAFKSIKRLLVSETAPSTIKKLSTLKRSEWTYNSFSNAYGKLGVTGSIEKAVHEMTLLYELLDRIGVKLSVGVYPWPAQIIEMARNNTNKNLQVDLWRDFCVNKCKNFINLFPRYYDEIKNSSVEDVYRAYFIKGDLHYNREGNRLIYEALLELNLIE